MEISAEITGNSKIECGVGAVDITLKGEKESYKIVGDKGIGSLKIEGTSMGDNISYGSGENVIKVDGGVGSINIDFE